MTKFVNWSKDFKHGVARQEEKGNTSRHRVRWRQMIRFGDLYREKPKEAENKALVLAEDVLSESSCSSQKFLQIIQSFKGKKKNAGSNFNFVLTKVTTGDLIHIMPKRKKIPKHNMCLLIMDIQPHCL